MPATLRLCLPLFVGACALASRVERREVVRDCMVFDCGAEYRKEAVENAMASHASASYDENGLPSWEIFLHPPARKEQGRARLTFARVSLPKVAANERLEFRAMVRLKTDIGGGKGGADGVRFVLRVDGREMASQPCVEVKPQPLTADLTEFQGREVEVVLETDMIENSAYDQATWERPRIVVAGRRETLTVEIPIFGIEPGEFQAESTQAVPVRAVDGDSAVVVAVPDRHLDLATMVQTAAADPANRPLVPLAPRLVVGEGPDPGNHTVVRILDRYGIPAVQFLAFPPAIRGGVRVEAGRILPGGRLGFVVAARSDQTKELRVFNEFGGLEAILQPDEIPPPYAIAVGWFVGAEDGGEQISVTSAQCPRADVRGVIVDGEGEQVGSFATDEDFLRGNLAILALPDGGMLLHAEGANAAFKARLRGEGVLGSVPLGAIPAGHRVFASVYGDGLVAAGPEEQFSHLRRLGGGRETVDVGARENRFWYGAGGAHAGEKSRWGEIPEGKHVRAGRFAHIRTDMHVARELGRNPALRAARSYQEWLDNGLAKGVPASHAQYDSQPPTTWEPCFTHRWIKAFVQELAAVKDAGTALPRYLMLDRNAKPVGYSEFDSGGFTVGTYSYGIPELESIYTYPVRHFLRQLAARHRANPEHFIAVEPNHEHEITSGAEDRASVADYHPANLRGFLDWLLNRHGTLAAINATYQTEFSATFFDAPRGRGRGDWDRYDARNPLFQAWFQYNARVVSRRVADTWREALLAGFPPESITCHQIPDSYAIGSLGAFSKPVSRVTPIDWMLTAGTSYGFTRYGVWYQRERNCIQGSWSSGFGMVTLGEYSALATTNEDAYGQLRYLHGHGAMFIHCMWWPSKWEKGRGYNDTFKYALRRLAEEDRPRMGVTGGVSMVRPYRSGDRQFDIVALGTGPDRNGLIKSVRQDGSWEGSVYVAPFHAHVAIDTLCEEKEVVLGQETWQSPELEGLTSGSQLETTFEATGVGEVVVGLRHDGQDLPGQAVRLNAVAGQRCRVIHRFQNRYGRLRLTFAADARMDLRDLRIVRHRDCAARIREGEFAGKRHRGGVTFAVLE